MTSVPHILALAILAVVANADTDWCTLPSCDGPNHTLCKYSFLRTDGQKCGKVESATLTQKEIQEILDTHNSMRAYVASGQETRGNPGPQPAATNLEPLEWDDELAGIAQTWADQCTFGHDACKDVDRFPVGQNVAFAGSTAGYDSSWSDVMAQWYNEVQKFNSNYVDGVPDQGFEGTAHYTQLVWADSRYVGCGGIRYNADDEWYKTYLVCNYGPAGNYVGMPVYETSV